MKRRWRPHFLPVALGAGSASADLPSIRATVSNADRDGEGSRRDAGAATVRWLHHRGAGWWRASGQGHRVGALR